MKRVPEFISILIFALAVVMAALVVMLALTDLIAVNWLSIRDILAAPLPSQESSTSLFGGTGITLALVVPIAAIGVTYYLAILSSRAQRRSLTVNSVLDRRMSAEFQTALRHREQVFKPGVMIDLAKFIQAYSDQSESTSKGRDAADSVVLLLNHYEFIATCVREKVFDEVLLRKTIRGIMCSFVSDCRFIVSDQRASDDKIYEALVWLYDNWRDDQACNRDGNPTERPIPP